MLDDLERKLLRVLNNYYMGHKSMPSMVDLRRKTGRKETVILLGLNKLQEQGYIDWQPPNTDTIKILEAWDRDAPSKPKETTKTDLSYWTNY